MQQTLRCLLQVQSKSSYPKRRCKRMSDKLASPNRKARSYDASQDEDKPMIKELNQDVYE